MDKEQTEKVGSIEASTCTMIAFQKDEWEKQVERVYQKGFEAGKLSASPKWPSEGAVGDWYSIWAESHTGKDGYSRFKAIMAFYSWLREKWAIEQMKEGMR